MTEWTNGRTQIKMGMPGSLPYSVQVITLSEILAKPSEVQSSWVREKGFSLDIYIYIYIVYVYIYIYIYIVYVYIYIYIVYVYDGLSKCLFPVLLINRNSMRAASCLPLKNMTYLDDVKTWKFFVTFGNLKPQESANARRFSFAVAGTIS